MRPSSPAQFPSAVAPKQAATGSPTRSTNSSQVHVKNLPSTPSESASWEEKNPPSGCCISRSRYSTVSVDTRR